MYISHIKSIGGLLNKDLKMLTLKNGVQVRIVKESVNVVTVESLVGCGFDSLGNEIKEVWHLSKKHHKGALLLDGISIL